VIGPAPRHGNLWFAFGHAHHGLTLAAVTGRLVAEMITGQALLLDAAPYSPQRFAA
jgi:D-amino-acid dehydrogenase